VQGFGSVGDGAPESTPPWDRLCRSHASNKSILYQMVMADEGPAKSTRAGLLENFAGRNLARRALRRPPS